MNVTCTGVERLDVVQVPHWKLAEMTGEAKRNTRSSESLKEYVQHMSINIKYMHNNIMVNNSIIGRFHKFG